MQTFTTLQYKGKPYRLDLNYQSKVIKLFLRHQNRIYYNEFDADFIQDLTKKTGNYKKMEIFTEMMFKCAQGTSKILSFSIKEFGIDESKLYLVMTYSVAYDRVHYPLPLIIQPTESLDISSENFKSFKENSGQSSVTKKPADRIGRNISRQVSTSRQRKAVNISLLLKNVVSVKKCVSNRDFDSAYKELNSLENILRSYTRNDESSLGREHSPSPVKKYKIIKSEPLIDKRPAFKRFDPTEYY